MTKRTPEQLVNDRIQRSIGKCPWVDACRVENKVGHNGWTDWVLFSNGGVSTFMESKAYHKWTPEQRNFAKRRVARGFRVFIVRGTPEDTSLIEVKENKEHVDGLELVMVARYGPAIPTVLFLTDMGVLR